MRRLFFAYLLFLSTERAWAEITLRERIKGQDEPQIVSWRVLEGVTEPFEEGSVAEVPAWKQMKTVADQKAANMAIQQALSDYGQLLRHPNLFGDMPLEERYDVFLSMARLLKLMGFQQRAELLLYEAMSYTTQPYEAHYQLGLLALDKEDLEKAKMHFKNCLFFREDDVLILVHLSVVLIAEGKTHESKFFISRILSSLEFRVRKLLFLVKDGDLAALTAHVDHGRLARWTEELTLKVFHGEFKLTPAAVVDLFRMFSNLYQFQSTGQLKGRIEFDLGQALYEGGRPSVGRLMMLRGHATADPDSEGDVSMQVVALRLAIDYPVVPASVLEVVEAYLNMTLHLASTAATYETIPLENVMDVYWPLPLWAWTGLPVGAVAAELLWRFSDVGVARGAGADQAYRDLWLSLFNSSSSSSSSPSSSSSSAESRARVLHWEITRNVAPPTPALAPNPDPDPDSQRFLQQQQAAWSEALSGRRDAVIDGKKVEIARDSRDGLWRTAVPAAPTAAGAGAGAGGACQKQPSVPAWLGRLRQGDPRIRLGVLGGHLNGHSVGQAAHRLLRALSASSPASSTRPIHVTLLALPLVPDAYTRRIASLADAVINVPLSAQAVHARIRALMLDVLLLPDWQPFPDVISPVFQMQRLAPVQVCFFVRGSSCPGSEVDYYLLPAEIQEAYLDGLPRSRPGSAARPPWLEGWAEQVVLVSLPLLSPAIIKEEAAAAAPTVNETATQPSSSPSSSSKTLAEAGAAGAAGAGGGGLDLDGQIFFQGQPVALLPAHPSQLHPAMDEVLLKLLQACPSLQLVLVLPEVYLAYGVAAAAKHKMVWARHLVRRLWAKAGSLHSRIRLLPAPVSDQRFTQLATLADAVLDPFPFGLDAHLLALALAVGTPVVTMRSGAALDLPASDVKALWSMLTSDQARARHASNVVFHSFVRAAAPTPTQAQAQGQAQGQGSKMPWRLHMSSVAAFYQLAGLRHELVADNVSAYFDLASRLLTDRERGYGVRVALLEAVDAGAARGAASQSCDAEAEAEAGAEGEGEGEGEDVAEFLIRVGLPWARLREAHSSKANDNNRRKKTILF